MKITGLIVLIIWLFLGIINIITISDSNIKENRINYGITWGNLLLMIIVYYFS